MTFATHVKAAAVRELLELEQIRGGTVPKAFVCQLAADIGASTRTLYRWLRDAKHNLDRPNPQRRHLDALTNDHVDAVFQHVGNLKKAKPYLDKRDPDIAAMSYATFRRLWKAQPPEIQAAAAGGIHAAMAAQVKMLYSPKERNEIWHIDQQELPIWVIPRGHSVTRVKPWLTTIMDAATRRIMSAVLHVERGNTETTTVAVADAMRPRPLSEEGQWAGGKPGLLYSDNGGEFTSNQLKAALAALDVAGKRSFPYMKHLNGKIERVQRTMQDGLISTLPGYTGGPKTLSGKNLFGTEAVLMSEAELWIRICDWVDFYNAERPHASLGGLTPNQAWCAQHNELLEVDAEAIRLAMLLRGREYKVQPAGVFFNDRYYMSPEFARRGLVGRKVSVRYMPGDPSFIEVFVGDEWVCTAVPHENLSDGQRAEIDQIRRARLTDARAHMDAAAEARFAEAYGGDGAVIVDLPQQPREVPFGDADDDIEPEVGEVDGDPFADILPDLGL